MSNASQQPSRDAPSTVPRAVIHKKILDASEAAPTASLQEIADEVTGASVALVEKVLDEYGDPAAVAGDGGAEDATPAAAEPTETEPSEDEPSDGDGAGPPDGDGTNHLDAVEERESDVERDAVDPADDGDALDAVDDHKDEIDGENDATAGTEAGVPDGDGEEPGADGVAVDLAPLDEKQRRTLRAATRRPDATQRELAEHLGVSAPTVSNRLNAIPGFSWSDRAEVFDDLREAEATGSSRGTTRMARRRPRRRSPPKRSRTAPATGRRTTPTSPTPA